MRSKLRMKMKSCRYGEEWKTRNTRQGDKKDTNRNTAAVYGEVIKRREKKTFEEIIIKMLIAESQLAREKKIFSIWIFISIYLNVCHLALINMLRAVNQLKIDIW